jgi:RalA-binding protein 1
MGSSLDDRSLLSVAEFLSSDIVQKHDSQLLEKRTSIHSSSASTKSPTRVELPPGNLKDGNPTKEGYLTKRGKKYGGWQTRYFVLDGPQLRYFDAVSLSPTLLTLAKWSTSWKYQVTSSTNRST